MCKVAAVPCVAVATTTTAAPTGRQVYVSRGRKDAGPLQAFISCRLFYGIAEGLTSRLQSVQNAAARLVSGARRYDHIMSVLQELQLSALASGSTSGGFEDGHPSLPATVQPIWQLTVT